MPPLHLYLYRTPDWSPQPADPLVVGGKMLPTWQHEHIEAAQLECSFELALERLGQMPRLFIEPDGSFVWRGAAESEPWIGPWQLEGMLYDHGGRLSRVELRGACPRQQWLQLTHALQPDGRLTAYLVDHGRFVVAGDLLVLWDP